MVQKVAVIGTGISGLTSIKACLDEGLEPTCFESSHDIGGLWRFKTTVVSVRQTPDFAATGQWEVETERREGQRETRVFDAVMVCTGHFTQPHLPLSDFPALQAKSGYRLRLYKHVFPPALTQPTLAVVGFIHGLGAINPLAEMQARWATRVFKGFTTFPSEETMMKEIEKDTVTMHLRYACSERNPLQVDYIPYLDSLAEQVGVQPNILLLFLKDPRLALEVWLGPCTPYQYRLTGPGRWAGACQAILTQWVSSSFSLSGPEWYQNQRPEPLLVGAS